MGRFRGLLFGAVLFAAGLWLGTWRTQPAQPAKASASAVSAASDDRLARIDRELDRLHSAVAELRREVAQQQPVMHAARAADEAIEPQAAAADPTALGGPAPPPGPARSESEYAAFVAQRFEREASDASWQAARDLRAKLQQVLPQGVRLRSFDCRTSMCRLETTHPDRDSYRDFTQYFSFMGGSKQVWSGSGFFHVTHEPESAGDELVAVTYLGRESLPSADPPR